jgi:hypothetical protein
MNTIHTAPGTTMHHYRAELGEGGLLKPDNKLHVTEIMVLAENDKRLVLNDNHFTVLSKESKSYINSCIGKESIHIYANDSVYGSSVHYSLYTYTKVRASTIRKHIETAIKKKYGFLLSGLNLDCIVEPVPEAA